MFTVYIFYSGKSDRFYVGYTADITKRILEHKSGMEIGTSKGNDWEVRFIRQFET